MKKLLFLFVLLLFIGCKDDQDDVIQVPPTENLEVEDFVYKAMNYVYYWQKDVPNLADNKFSNDKEYTAFLQSFNGPEDLFNNLKFKEEDYSRIYDDYEAFERRSKAIALSNGMKFGLIFVSRNNTNIFGYVQYVFPNTDAAQKGIKRGDIFTHVNGNQLTIDNFRELLLSNKPSYTIDLATLNNNQLQPTGARVTLTNTQQTIRRIYTSKVIPHDGKKVGYIMYNGFTISQEDDLKNVFTDFATQQIDELVLDLRYNPGGFLSTAQLLAGLIAGEHAGKVFGKIVYNDKLRTQDTTIDIIDSNIQLGLSRVFVLTTQNSASASELIINGLRPYLNVIQIGDKTEGKDVGSIDIYDYIDNKNKNPNHKWMLLPITFKLYNSEGVGDYSEGLQPNVPLPEVLSNLGVLGETNEPLLEKALDVISGKISVGSSLTTHGMLSTFHEIPVEEGRAIYKMPKIN
jgi:carboxyl-terminal processing protease